MINFINKFIKITQNSNYIAQGVKDLAKLTPVKKIFDSIKNFSSDSEIRYVGGCIRKIIKKEKVDDIDLATNLSPNQVCDALNKDNIDYYKTGIEHGTITAVINDYHFEITSLREDVATYGRHAEVKFSTDWKKDASRRDFTFNAIYSDIDGNLFDPFNGKDDLEKGIIKFIGEPEKRIQEDYLRILRYLRFYLSYSNHEHDLKTAKLIKKNIVGISNLSKERLLDELKKLIKSNLLTKLSRDKFSIELFEIVFPQIKNIKIFSYPNEFTQKKIAEADFIFLLSVLIIDGSDNADYFIYKFNISKKDQKRLKIIDNFYKEKITSKSFSENNLNKIFYYTGKQSVIDILSYKLLRSKKINNKFIKFIDEFQSKILPTMPFGARILMKKYQIPEGKYLGDKLKIIEEEWVNNNFQLTEKQIDKIINH
ncbi:CCA tRNA nucleotidyltransferase [Candidatus Pelagibacter communis]|uniref:CCA tRNA nucleotidyltransferase n=1 Tax=Pelagibacter ubique TaxID=198252 RepID=UPI00094C7ABD|nr:CCA tRNA nucleotidyltransferase [Candidatus Pelagibacter ubique]